jgi:hypothetical protein
MTVCTRNARMHCHLPQMECDSIMETLTVRRPEALIAQIEVESWRRRLSKSDVVRERLTGTIGGTDACVKIGGPIGVGVDTPFNGQH